MCPLIRPSILDEGGGGGGATHLRQPEALGCAIGGQALEHDVCGLTERKLRMAVHALAGEGDQRGTMDHYGSYLPCYCAAPLHASP